MAFTSFTRQLGKAQGRIKPTNATPYAGEWVMCLGSDHPGEMAYLNASNRVEMAQDVEVSGRPLIRMRASIRGPETLPPAGVMWLLSWFVGGNQQAFRIVTPRKRVDLDDLVFYVNGLTGVHTLKVRLTMVVLPT